MGRRGRKRQLGLESEYWELLGSGVGTVAACKLLGIGRKTGYRWRAENGGLPPARLAEAARSGRYLSLLERQRIATLRDRGLGVREIARRLGRSASTVSRELRRHLRPHDRGVYDGDLAHARARERLRRPRRPVLSREPELRQIIQDKPRAQRMHLLAVAARAPIRRQPPRTAAGVTGGHSSQRPLQITTGSKTSRLAGDAGEHPAIDDEAVVVQQVGLYVQRRRSSTLRAAVGVGVRLRRRAGEGLEVLPRSRLRP